MTTAAVRTLPWAGATGRSIPDRFLAVAEHIPDAVAVETATRSTTYAELRERALRLAAGIVAAGGVPGRPVAIALREPEDNVAAILATLLAGAIYAPLDLAFPPERIERVLADAEPALVVADADLPDLGLSTPVAHPADLELDRPLAVGGGDPDAAASLLYTSGSTGRPKGVLQSHRNILFHTQTLTERFDIGPADKHSLVSSFSFDASTTDLYCAILNGATLVPLDLRRDGLAHLGARLAQHGVTLYHSTPTIFRELAAALAEDVELPRLRLIVLGGEPVTEKDVRLFRKRFADDCVFVNGYGATETGGFVGLYELTKGDPPPGPVVPVGWPPDGVELSLRDRSRPRQELEEGELTVTSRHVALGYLHDEARASYETDPDRPGVRTYWTGDLGRRLADGAILVTGRRDRQVKIRGFRVELGEVEAALASLAGVRRAAVAVRDADGAAADLVAFIELVAGAQDDAPGLRRRVARLLPEYSVPARVEIVDRLPLTPTGKVDVRALRVAPPRRRNAVPPAGAGPTARSIAAAWADVLEAGEIGPDDNFFDLGGNSLLLTRVHERLERELGLELPAYRLFEYPTVRALASFLDGEADESGSVRDAERRMAKRRERRAQRAGAARGSGWGSA